MAKILLVDDDRQIRDMLKLTLERVGHSVVEAENGVQAVSNYSADAIDLVITDIVMPEKEDINELTGTECEQVQ